MRQDFGTPLTSRRLPFFPPGWKRQATAVDRGLWDARKTWRRKPTGTSFRRPKQEAIGPSLDEVYQVGERSSSSLVGLKKFFIRPEVHGYNIPLFLTSRVAHICTHLNHFRWINAREMKRRNPETSHSGPLSKRPLATNQRGTPRYRSGFSIKAYDMLGKLGEGTFGSEAYQNFFAATKARGDRATSWLYVVRSTIFGNVALVTKEEDGQLRSVNSWEVSHVNYVK